MRLAEMDQRLRRAGLEREPAGGVPAAPPDEDLDFDPDDGDTGRTGRFRLRKR